MKYLGIRSPNELLLFEKIREYQHICSNNAIIRKIKGVIMAFWDGSFIYIIDIILWYPPRCRAQFEHTKDSKDDWIGLSDVFPKLFDKKRRW